MGATAQDAQSRREIAAPQTGRGDAGVAARLAAPLAVALALLAMLLLGPPLGALLFPPSPLHFWADIGPGQVLPEPTEDARYLLALLAPLLLAGLTILLTRRPPRRLAAATARRLAAASEVAVAGGLLACLAAQRLAVYPQSYSLQPHIVYFTVPTLVVAALGTLALAVGIRSAGARTRFAAWTADTTARRLAAGGVALAAIVLTVLAAVMTDSSIALGQRDVLYHLSFTYDETMAVFDGRSPLGNFAAQYGSLWPYLAAAVMVPFGASLATFTVSLAALTGATMLALFAVLRRVTRSALAGLLLFLPVLATAAWRLHGSSVDRFSVVNYFGTMPLRYAGAFLLVWLTARHLDGAWPRRAWPLFLAGGLVVLNNTDFGVPALAGTVAALLWSRRWPTAAPRRVALEALAGLAAAAALVTALVLVRTGGPPHAWLLLRYSEVFVRGGFGLRRIHPLVGLSTIVFATYAIALGVATVRALNGARDRLLTGLLAWSAIFGLGSFSYYVGRSIPELVEHLFAGWAFALALLTVVAVRAIARRPGGRATPLELACLAGFCLLVCSLAQTPAPWGQAQRLGRVGPAIFAAPAGQEFVAAHAQRGERVAILFALGHRIAADLGVENVSPYTGTQSIPTSDQMVDVVDELRREGGTKLFLRASENGQLVAQLLARLRFRVAAEDPQTTDQLWVRR